MRLLALETATEVCSTAFMENGRVLSESSVRIARKHAESLSPMIAHQIQFLPFTLHELDAVAISIGPGSFTGLRIGLSTAKGLIFGTSVKLLAIPTLAASAWGLRNRTDQIQVLHHSHRDFYFYALYDVKTELKTVHPPRRDQIAKLRSTIDPALPLFVDQPEKFLQGNGFGALTLLSGRVQATSVAQLAAANPDRWEVNDPYLVEPDYLREYEAVKYKNPLSQS